MGAIKIKQADVQDLSMNAIEVLPELLQTRAKTDIGFVRAYAKAMAEGSVFPPVIVYETPDGRLLLADGFTRHAAAASLKQRSIKAVVRKGTLEDAILGGMDANFDPYHSRSVTDADRRHAVELMIRNEKFRHWSDMEISRRSGVNNCTVGKIRVELLDAESIPLPLKVEQISKGLPTGKFMKYRQRIRRDRRLFGKSEVQICTRTDNGVESQYVKLNGIRIPVGKDRDVALEKFREIQEQRNDMNTRLRTAYAFAAWLSRRNIATTGISIQRSPLGGFVCHGAAFHAIAEPTLEAFLSGVARLILTKQYIPSIRRLILVGYFVSVNSIISRLWEPVATLGIEIMTPEELVVEFGGTEPINEQDNIDDTSAKPEAE